MVRSCCVKGCKAHWTPNTSLSFFSFPKDVERKRKWLEAINMNHVAKSAYLCSNHFLSTDFNETVLGYRQSLKKTAVPVTISREISDHTYNKIAPIEEQCHIKVEMDASNIESLIKKDSDEIQVEGNNTQLNYNMCHLRKNSLKRKLIEHPELDVPLKNVKSMRDIDLSEVSKKPDEAKMALEVAMEIIKDQNRRIRNLQSHVNKLKRRISSLTSLKIHSRKKTLVSDQVMDHLNNHYKLTSVKPIRVRLIT